MLSYAKAKEITKANEAFYLKEVETPHPDYNAIIGTYMLASYSDFAEHDAFEMRGCTWITDKNFNVIDEHATLSIPKFFNVNECPLTDEKHLSDLTLVGVWEKMDGSLAQPVLFPDGKTYWKSKTSFKSEHAHAMNALAEKNGINEKIKPWLEQGYHLLFEFVSPRFPIVVQYPEEKFVLIAVRDKEGHFIDINSLDLQNNFHLPYRYPHSFQELLEMRDAEEGYEGWILHFNDGTVAKLKTKWYLDRHRLTELNVSHVATLVLEEKIDDVMTDAPEHIRKFVEIVEEAVVSKYNHYIHQIIDSFKGFNGERKDYAISNNKEPWFGVAMKVFDSENREDPIFIGQYLTDWMMKQVNKEKKAKEFLGLNDIDVFNVARVEK